MSLGHGASSCLRAAKLCEETYEVAEAIDADNPVMREELGDVLFQVALHSQIESEKGSFGMGEVIDGICKKLIHRHPHVFGNVKAGTAAEVLRNWNAIKRDEKGRKNAQTKTLEAVPRVLPALMRSQKITSRASTAGVGFSDVDELFSCLRRYLSKLEVSVRAGNESKSRKALGDLLFAAAGVSLFIDCKPEEALTRSCDDFIARFKQMEIMAAHQGCKLSDMSHPRLLELFGVKQNRYCNPL